jgi:site-specific DNA recombinase
MLLQMRGMFAQYEKTKIQERVRRGKERALNDGRILSRMAPYGYTKDGKTFAVNEVEADVVREIFALMASGAHTLYSIAVLMRARGYPNKRGGHWYVSTIQRILNNETYTGTYHAALAHWKDGKRTARPRSEWIPIEVPAIISRPLFDRANACIWQNKKYSNRNRRHPHLLTGFITCAHCGASYKSWAKESEAHRTYRYYSCPMRTNHYRTQGQPRCNNSACKGTYLDDDVWALVVEALTTRAVLHEDEIAHARITHAPHQQALHASVQALERLDKEEARLISAYRIEAITIDQLQEQMTDIRRKRTQEEARKQEAETALTRLTIITQEELSAIDALRRDISTLTFTLDNRRAILKLLRFQGVIDGPTLSITTALDTTPMIMHLTPPTLVVPRLS